jgi:ABC-2 type transport system permease protein
LNSFDAAWRYREVVRAAIKIHLTAVPWSITVTTQWPRAVLQCLFFTLLGRVAGGEYGQRFAFIGSLAAITTLHTVVAVCDVPAGDKWQGTFVRLRLGVLAVPNVYAVRTAPILLDATIVLGLCLLVVGPATGEVLVSIALLPTLPIFMLMMCTSACAGLAVAAPAVSRNADVFVGNALSYLTIAAAGCFIPAGRLPWLDTLGSVLPVRHGLAAIRATQMGRTWHRQVLLEFLVGLTWGGIAWVLYRRQVTRARDSGADDFG